MIDKYESRRIRTEIRRVLLNVWDAIGIGDQANAQDEYDCCLGTIYHLLTDGASNEKIRDYLWTQATEHMGWNVRKEAMTPTVEALRKINLP